MVFDPALVTEEMIETRYTQAIEPVTLATSRQLYSKESIGATAAPRVIDARPYTDLTQLDAVKGLTKVQRDS